MGDDGPLVEHDYHEASGNTNVRLDVADAFHRRFNVYPLLGQALPVANVEDGDRSKGQDTSDKWVLILLLRVRVYVAQSISVLTGLSSYLDHRNDSAQQTTHRTTSAISHQSSQSQCVRPDTLASMDPLLSEPHVHE